MQESDPVPDEGLGWFAGSTRGRVVLSAILAFIVIALVVWNLPDSAIRDELRPGVRPAVNALALDQSWSVFAPDPTTMSFAVEADVYLADGTRVRYTFPHGDDVVGAYREYRWRKWERRIRLDRNDHLWPETASWVRDQFDDDVTKVVLIRRFSETPEPGTAATRSWRSVEFFELTFEGGAT